MKNSIKRIQSESLLSTLLSARILREANKAYQYIALAALALSFAACTQEDDFTPQGDLKDTPITIQSAGVAELSTRAIRDGKLVGTADETATIGVFITGGSGTKYNANNMKWEHNGTGWTSEETILFEGAASNQKIAAYRPYEANAASGSVTVMATEQTDWLVATSTDLTTNIVNLTMTHALTKLVLQPTFGSEVINPNIANVEVQNMYASGTLNISDNSWSNLPEANTTLEMMHNEVLVIPMSNCTSFPIVVTMVDGRTFKTDISLAKVNNELVAGTQYNIKLQIGQNKVTSVTADVSSAVNEYQGL